MRRSQLVAAFLALLGLSGSAIPFEAPQRAMQAQVDFSDATVAGALEVSASEGSLTVRGHPAEFLLTAARAKVTLVTVTREYVDQPKPDYVGWKVEDHRDEYRFVDSAMRIDGGEAPPALYVLRRAAQGQGSLSLPLGQVVGRAFDPGTDAATFALGQRGQVFAFEDTVDPPFFGVGDGNEPAPFEADLDAAHAHGSFLLALDNATLWVTAPDGEYAFATGEWTEDDTSAGPLGVRHRTVRTYALVEVEGGDLALRLGAAEARFLSPRPTYHLEGRAVFHASDAAVRLNDTSLRPGRGIVEVVGDLTIRPTARAGAVGLVPLEEGAPRLNADVRGNATYVAFNGRALALGLPEAVRAASLVALAGAALAALWGKVAPFLFPLYARISGEDALSNEVRLRLFQEIRANPLIHQRELHRRAGVSYGCAAYHLDVLKRRQFVASLPLPTKELYYVPTPEFPPSVMAQVAALADPTRNRVARAVAAAGQATQADLQASLGLGQSLLSRHLTRLCRDGLVEATGMREKRYGPTPLLRSWLHLGLGSPPPGRLAPPESANA